MKVGGRHEHFLIVFDKNLLEAHDEFGEERICDIGDNEAVGATLPILQRGRVAVGKELSSSMTRRTRSAVAGVTRSDPLMTRDTVALETPAIFAMSRISISVASVPGQRLQHASGLPMSLHEPDSSHQAPWRFHGLPASGRLSRKSPESV
jgi:hypothetical protein